MGMAASSAQRVRHSMSGHLVAGPVSDLVRSRTGTWRITLGSGARSVDAYVEGTAVLSHVLVSGDGRMWLVIDPSVPLAVGDAAVRDGRVRVTRLVGEALGERLVSILSQEPDSVIDEDPMRAWYERVRGHVRCEVLSRAAESMVRCAMTGAGEGVWQGCLMACEGFAGSGDAGRAMACAAASAEVISESEDGRDYATSALRLGVESCLTFGSMVGEDELSMQVAGFASARDMAEKLGLEPNGEAAGILSRRASERLAAVVGDGYVSLEAEVYGDDVFRSVGDGESSASSLVSEIALGDVGGSLDSAIGGEAVSGTSVPQGAGDGRPDASSGQQRDFSVPGFVVDMVEFVAMTALGEWSSGLDADGVDMTRRMFREALERSQDPDIGMDDAMRAMLEIACAAADLGEANMLCVSGVSMWQLLSSFGEDELSTAMLLSGIVMVSGKDDDSWSKVLDDPLTGHGDSVMSALADCDSDIYARVSEAMSRSRLRTRAFASTALYVLCDEVFGG